MLHVISARPYKQCRNTSLIWKCTFILIWVWLVLITADMYKCNLTWIAYQPHEPAVMLSETLLLFSWMWSLPELIVGSHTLPEGCSSCTEILPCLQLWRISIQKQPKKEMRFDIWSADVAPTNLGFYITLVKDFWCSCFFKWFIKKKT